MYRSNVPIILYLIGLGINISKIKKIKYDIIKCNKKAKNHYVQNGHTDFLVMFGVATIFILYLTFKIHHAEFESSGTLAIAF